MYDKHTFKKLPAIIKLVQNDKFHRANSQNRTLIKNRVYSKLIEAITVQKPEKHRDKWTKNEEMNKRN